MATLSRSAGPGRTGRGAGKASGKASGKGSGAKARGARGRGGALQCRAAMDSQTLMIVGAAVAGIGAGIGIPVFYSMQADASATRENQQACFACEGSGVQVRESARPPGVAGARGGA